MTSHFNNVDSRSFHPGTITVQHTEHQPSSNPQIQSINEVLRKAWNFEQEQVEIMVGIHAIDNIFQSASVFVSVPVPTDTAIRSLINHTSSLALNTKALCS